ncbi:hypothetical protein VT50_0226025 [Streptomyces antioxidans]|uniref:Uncharacterized protein n=1 Tax=Streptomyces antioxidans TaxID=1507734 RepID=A0A1V4CZA6_9ACTN|nr:hypothetical protein [Streptomyces antioxidans]OPF74619.1 hypothetical protein VT50_0226025 [Streptomyces antioxidans]
MSEPRTSTSPRMLGIYLNDHLAGATAGTQLAGRTAREHRQSPLGGDLENVAVQIMEDRAALLTLMADLEVPVRRYKVYGGWLGERAGRLKPNGRLRRRSGLSTVLELESLRIGVEGKALLWQALLATAGADPRLDPDRLTELLDRARRQRATLESLHEAAAAAMFRPGRTEPREAVVGT